ncbi:hypothetical protein MMC17_005140 [Xylographa soralifera]|nr:hypothetical protein [Xylographa soralifera]
MPVPKHAVIALVVIYTLGFVVWIVLYITIKIRSGETVPQPNTPGVTRGVERLAMTPPEGTQDRNQVTEQLATVHPSNHEETLAQGQVHQSNPNQRLQHEDAECLHRPALTLQHCYSRDNMEFQSHVVANSRQPQTDRQHQPRGYEVQNPKNPAPNSHSQRMQQDTLERPDIMMNGQGRAMRDLELGTAGLPGKD